MPSFGEKLKREREKRAITLEQISTSTKIGTRMLQALEKEDFDQLPGGIFNKGFVRAYARHVGLDEDEAIADYLEASGQNVVPRPEAGTQSAPAADDSGEFRPPWPALLGWLAATLLIVALALTLWSRRHHNHNKEAHPQPGLPSSSENAAASNTAASSAGPITSISGSATAARGVPSSEARSPSQVIVPAPRPASADAGLLATPAGEFTVVVLAREDSWVSITADGKISEETLFADNQRTIHARNEVTIKAGNTGGLDFVFNGKKLGSQGDYGEVKTLVFGAAGLLPQAASPPSQQ